MQWSASSSEILFPTIWYLLIMMANIQHGNKQTMNCDNLYHESFSSAFTPTNMQFIAMLRRFHFRWANFHLLSLFSNFIALIRPRISISSERLQRCQREIRMYIAQAYWSLSNVHNVHNIDNIDNVHNIGNVDNVHYVHIVDGLINLPANPQDDEVEN